MGVEDQLNSSLVLHDPTTDSGADAIVISYLDLLVLFNVGADSLSFELSSAPDITADPDAEIHFVLLVSFKVEHMQMLLVLLIKFVNGVFFSRIALLN